MTENTYLAILGVLLAVIQLGIGAFLMSLIRRVNKVEAKTEGIQSNYLTKFSEVNRNIGNIQVAVLQNINENMVELSDKFEKSIHNLTQRIDTAMQHNNERRD